MGNAFTMRNSTSKMFKHLEFIPLIHVRSVVQFRDSDSGGKSVVVGVDSINVPSRDCI